MPRYFFTIVDGVELEDPEGSEHETVGSAIEEARLMAREIMADGIRGGLDRRRWSIRIVKGDGEIVALVPFADTAKPDTLRVLTRPR